MYVEPTLFDRSGLYGSDLVAADVPRLGSDLEKVRAFAANRGWFTIPQIRDGTGIQMDGSVSRYLRYLRAPEHGGFIVEKQRRSNGLWEYRVTSEEV